MYRSIFLIVLFALSAFALTLRQPSTPFIDPIEERCAKAHGITRNIFRRDNNITVSDLTNSTTGCFVACIWEARGQLSENGTVRTSDITDNLPSNLADRDEVIKAMRDCFKESGENQCETLSKIMVCIFNSEVIRNMHPIRYSNVRPVQ